MLGFSEVQTIQTSLATNLSCHQATKRRQANRPESVTGSCSAAVVAGEIIDLGSTSLWWGYLDACARWTKNMYVYIYIYIYLFIEASIIYMKIHMFYIDHTFNILHLVHTKILNIIHYHSVILLHPLMTTRISTSGLKPSGTRTISTSNWWTGYHELLLDIHSFHILCIQETSWLPATKRGTGRLHCTKSFKRDDQLWCSKSLPQSEKGHPQKLMKPYASGKIFRNKLELTLCIFI